MCMLHYPNEHSDLFSGFLCHDFRWMLCEAVTMFDARDEPLSEGLVKKPTQPGSLILEAWVQGFLLGALIVMACVTVANMGRRILHKLILVEVYQSTRQHFHSQTLINAIPAASLHTVWHRHLHQRPSLGLVVSLPAILNQNKHCSVSGSRSTSTLVPDNSPT